MTAEARHSGGPVSWPRWLWPLLWARKRFIISTKKSYRYRQRRLPFPATAGRRSVLVLKRRIFRALGVATLIALLVYYTFLGLWWCHTLRIPTRPRRSLVSTAVDSPIPANRVAVCFFGLTRALRRHTLPTIQEWVFDKLTEQGFEYDVFLHTYHLDAVNNYRSHELNVTTDPLEWALLKPLKYELEDQESIDKELDFSLYESFGNAWTDDPTTGSLHNLLRQLRSVERVQQLMETYSIQNGVKYQYVIFLRPDVRYEYPGMPPLDYFDFDDRKVGVAYEDRAAIGTLEATKMWAKRRSSAIAYMNHTVPPRPLHSESLVRYHLTVKSNISVISVPWCFQRVRTTGHAVLEDLVQCRRDAWKTSPWRFADE